MELHELEQVVGRLYLVILDKERQIQALQAQLPQPKAPTLTVVPPREESSAG